MKKSVSVVIPCYNGKQLLEKYLPFLFKALQHAQLCYEIIVPDDASTDGSVLFLKEKYPAIKVIEAKNNCGFSGNANRGIFAAQNDLVFLMNTDVKLTENYFEPLLPHLERENVFGVMGALTTESTGELQDGAKYPQWKGSQLNFTLNYIFTDGKAAPSLFLSGANALMDRKKLQEAGGFNERFNPFYFEDAELGIRTWRMGWESWFEPKAICYHEISSTIKTHHQQQKIKNTARRNKFLLHHLHLEGRKRFFWKTEILFNLLFRWLIFKTDYYTSWKEYRKLKGGASSMKLKYGVTQVVGDLLGRMEEKIKVF